VCSCDATNQGSNPGSKKKGPLLGSATFSVLPGGLAFCPFSRTYVEILFLMFASVGPQGLIFFPKHGSLGLGYIVSNL